MNSDALLRAQQSLDGLSVGDAFGQRFFRPDAEAFVALRTLPSAPWYWTDDTEMALSIVDELREHQGIDPDSLVQRFVKRFRMNRGYGHGAVQWMQAVAMGQSWRDASTKLFEGMGSHGNGGAMRVAPLGAYFSGDPERAREEAQKSAIVTHAHPEGQAGAIAIAVAASIVSAPNPPQGHDLLRAVASFVPEGETRSIILRGTQLSTDSIDGVARVLGSGYNVSSQDTVPFALFAAAHHLYNFEAALWWTVAGLGDRDTTCAMVGGIVSMTAQIPEKWLKAREALDATYPPRG
jgi:ADP-ribosylglycohydrolase